MRCGADSKISPLDNFVCGTVFHSLPRMIQSSNRPGGGQSFFFETAELVVALGSSGGPSLCLPGRFAPKTARFARERVPKKIKTFY